ncbi:MAG TPA: TlpA disulfide reductase family protein [Burkholderiaceae bacterium]|nr:TlpA disulfide reductase family protein [Burkholderiaceae bacterium]
MSAPVRRSLLRALGAPLAACACAAATRPARAQSPAAAPRVVDWPAIRLLDGPTIEPAAWRDTAAVIVVWATWCPFCRRHNPHVEKLHRAVAGRPIRVIGASIDRDPEAVRRYAREQGYTFPTTMDAAVLRERLGLRNGLPLTAVVDRRGRLVQQIPGEMFEEDVLELARFADPPTGS